MATSAPTSKSIHTFVRNPPGAQQSQRKVLGVWNVAGAAANAPKESTVPPPPKAPGATRFVCVSDTHEQESKIAIPDGDVLIHAGDFTYRGSKQPVANFNNWLGKLPHPHKVVIAGNHDVTFHSEYYETHWLRYHQSKLDAVEIQNSLTNCHYLYDSEVTVLGYRIYGSPWQPEFCDWAFNLPADSPEIIRRWEDIPLGVDVLITHGPPSGHGGICLPAGNDAGCKQLLKAIKKKKPAVHVSGHIHEGYGVTKEDGVTFINASSVTLSYRPQNQAIVFDLQ